MKNIYQEDFSADNSRDVYSHSSHKPESTVKKPVRPAKHAPPPIKKSVISNKSAEADNAAYPPAGYVQPGFYPQPVFYQPDVNGQPVPVYYAPVQPAPAAYPQTPATAAPKAAADTADNEAGTRVLFQSADFDRNEDHATAEASYSSSAHLPFDLTEESLPSGKRAPAPVSSVASHFSVDEMEIGTYEFNIMTHGQTARAKSVLTPDEENEKYGLTEESLIDQLFEPEEEPAEDSPQKEADGTSSRTITDMLPSREIIRRAILGISVVAIIIACGTLINEYRLHRENKKLMDDLSGMIITEATTKAPETTKKNQSDKNPEAEIPTTLPLMERPLTIEEQWEALRQENPEVVFPEGLQLKYAKLYAQNTDFVGYLRAEGSGLDSPIVQGEDDEEYVEKNFYGEYTKYACPFITSTNTVRTLDDNTVIYGHHMRDGSIFGMLDQYRTLDGYKKAPLISFDTIYNDYDFKIIAVMVTNIYPKDDNGYVFTYYWTNLNNELNHTAYLNQLSQRSLYDTGVDVLPSDKLITLSTCCKDFEDARLVIVARLVRPGESTEVDTSLAIENENPRYPQAYYDAKGMKNPFADAYRWEIS